MYRLVHFWKYINYVKMSQLESFLYSTRVWNENNHERNDSIIFIVYFWLFYIVLDLREYWIFGLFTRRSATFFDIPKGVVLYFYALPSILSSPFDDSISLIYIYL